MYPNAKIYHDGSHYIAIPHTERQGGKRHKDDEEEFVVEETEDSPVSMRSTKDIQDGLMLIPQPEVMPFVAEDVEPQKTVTRKSEFERLYDESKGMSKAERKEYIADKMKGMFKNEQDCPAYVQLQIDNKKRAVQARRLRFIRKAYMNDFNYFATFTYDDAKHTEESFRRKLSMCFATFHKRKCWLYMGVWERAPKTNRLHFHGLFNIPKGGMPGELIVHRDYNTRNHKMQTTNQNTYFNERFGRTDFEQLDGDITKLGNALVYILKYIGKSEEKILYSRGLATYVISDIVENDVICNFGLEDKKLLLFDEFSCFDEGEYIGKMSKETMMRMRKAN